MRPKIKWLKPPEKFINTLKFAASSVLLPLRTTLGDKTEENGWCYWEFLSMGLKGLGFFNSGCIKCCQRIISGFNTNLWWQSKGTVLVLRAILNNTEYNNISPLHLVPFVPLLSFPSHFFFKTQRIMCIFHPIKYYYKAAKSRGVHVHLIPVFISNSKKLLLIYSKSVIYPCGFTHLCAHVGVHQWCLGVAA